MSIDISRAASTDVAGIRAFNRRLRDKQVDFQFPETDDTLGYHRLPNSHVWHETFVAREGDIVRGGYALKREPLATAEGVLELWNYQIPLSEGIIDRSYATLGIKLLRDAMARQPLLYALGMGSLQRPLPRLLERFKWNVEVVPFRFRVLRAKGFLRNIQFLRSRNSVRKVLDLARITGLGALFIVGWRCLARLRKAGIPQNFTVCEVQTFSNDADVIFQAARSYYGAVVERNSAVLNARFPASDHRLIRLMFYASNRPVGWIVLTRSQLHGHKQFGDMRLGCIADGFCAPEFAATLIGFSVERLRREQVDLVVSNQTHKAWLEGLRCSGFIKGPSNFIMARSPSLNARMSELSACHFNRGDGDGPINL